MIYHDSNGLEHNAVEEMQEYFIKILEKARLSNSRDWASAFKYLAEKDSKITAIYNSYETNNKKVIIEIKT